MKCVPEPDMLVLLWSPKQQIKGRSNLPWSASHAPLRKPLTLTPCFIHDGSTQLSHVQPGIHCHMPVIPDLYHWGCCSSRQFPASTDTLGYSAPGVLALTESHFLRSLWTCEKLWSCAIWGVSSHPLILHHQQICGRCVHHQDCGWNPG